VYKFKVTAEDIQMIMKAAAITGAPTVSVTCKNQAVMLSVSDRKNDTASNFKKSLGTSFDDFDVFIAVENLKVIPDAYDITVAKTPNGKAKFLHFKHESRQLQYCIAAEPGSVV
jgi:protein gp37